MVLPGYVFNAPEYTSYLSGVLYATGTITAGNASSLNDGAVAMILMSAEKVREGAFAEESSWSEVCTCLRICCELAFGFQRSCSCALVVPRGALTRIPLHLYGRPPRWVLGLLRALCRTERPRSPQWTSAWHHQWQRTRL